MIVTGGRSLERSSDMAVVRGAKEILRPAELSDRIVTFPDPEHPDYDTVFNGTRIMPTRASTRQARRFEMVRAADVVVSVAGSVGSPESIRLAQALEIPALPLLFTGASSAKMEKSARAFGLDDDSIDDWIRSANDPDSDLTPYVDDVVDMVLRRAVLPCFVAMPYGDETTERLYADAILPGVADAGFRAIRSDEEHHPGVILTQMLDSISTAGALIGLLSDDRYPRLDASGQFDQHSAGINPNVMFEVGFARALGIPSLLLARDAASLPFDLRVDRTIEYGDMTSDALRASVEAALRAVRSPRV